MPVIAIIPARFQSSRLPGKPLADIHGKPMIVRVWERCVLAGLDQVIIATDDHRIEKVVQDYGAEVSMTSAHCRSGTDRCAEVAASLPNDREYIVINVQGDEPFLHPSHLKLLAEAFADPTVQIATLAVAINDNERLFNPNTPKVALNYQSNALYFSRHAIPYVRDKENGQWITNQSFWKHIGIYAYRVPTLLKLSSLPETDLEKSESLEQLRWLYHGYPIRVLTVEEDTMTVDTLEDLEAARQWAQKITGE